MCDDHNTLALTSNCSNKSSSSHTDLKDKFFDTKGEAFPQWDDCGSRGVEPDIVVDSIVNNGLQVFEYRHLLTTILTEGWAPMKCMTVQ